MTNFIKDLEERYTLFKSLANGKTAIQHDFDGERMTERELKIYYQGQANSTYNILEDLKVWKK